ncbi:MAG: O-antigen ligase family protein [Armatimonadota bacterium]
MDIARLCLLLTAFLVPLLGARSGVLPVAVFAVLAAGGWLGWAIIRPRPPQPTVPLRWPLAALVFITALTTLTSVYQPASILGSSQMVIVASLALLAMVLPLERRHLAAGAAAFAISALLGMGYGLFGWFDWLMAKHVYTWRVQSSWENANFYAGFLVTSLPILAVLAAYATRLRWRVLLWASFILGVLCLVMTQSRGGVLAFFVGLLVLGTGWLWAAGKLSARGVGLLAAGAILFIALALISPVGRRVWDPQLRAKQQHSQDFRLYTWQGTLRMITANPLHGTGPNTFPSAFGQYQIAGYTRHAHNIFLHTAAEMGWPGMAALLWLFGAVVVVGMRGIRRARALPSNIMEPTPPAPTIQDTHHRSKRTHGKTHAAPITTTAGIATDFLPATPVFSAAACAALIASTVGLAVHGLLDTHWLYTGIQLTLLLQAALVWRLVAQPASERPAAGWTRVVMPAALILIALSLLPGVRAEQLDDQAGWTKEADEKLELYRAAVELAPMNAAYLRRASSYVSKAAEGETYLARARRLEPTNAANWLFWGHLQLRSGKYKEAAEAYRIAQQKESDLIAAVYGEAEARWRAGDPKAALRALDNLTATKNAPFYTAHPVEIPIPWYTRAAYLKAQLALKAGDIATAQQAFTDTIQEAQVYRDGYTDEAAAAADFSGTTSEYKEIHDLATMSHEELARLLQKTDPAAAELHKKEVDSRLHIPKEKHGVPFP